jgi:hypothetical protein
MLELPPAAAEEYARQRATKAADLPFVFEIYAQSISQNMWSLMAKPVEEREEICKSILAVSTDAVRVLKEGYM